MKTQKGFTLIELVMVLIIVSIVSVFLGRFLQAGYQNYLVERRILNVITQGHLVLETMVNDIHLLRSTADLSAFSSTGFTLVDIKNNTIQYALSGNNLLRNTYTLATNISNLNITYYDKNGAVTAAVNSVRFIAITFNMTFDNFTQAFAAGAFTRENV